MNDLISAITAAVAADPEALPLRLHLAELLIANGDRARAVAELSQVLMRDAAHERAQQLMREALGGSAAATPAVPAAQQPPAAHEAPESAAATGPADQDQSHGIDWARLEQEVDVTIDPPFVGATEATAAPHPMPVDGDQAAAELDEAPETPEVTLADVGGLQHVKDRLNVAFLDPMRNPEIAKAFQKSLRGGLLLYGPPGTGKTFIAKAIAGELGAKFLTVTVADVLNSFIGESEKNVQRLFERARKHAPCVLFLDELDSIGGKRSMYGSSATWMRGVVNQLLLELDGVGSKNDGLFVLAATNHPWDVDDALMRPGRFDRVVLVTPPDAEARIEILRGALAGRPVAGIDLAQLAARSDRFSGADLEHLATTAAEKAMTDSIASGQVRPVTMADFDAAFTEVQPSTGGWMQNAVNVVTFGNADGRYDELEQYLTREKFIK
ncbi:AAA family ATPase [Leucobacter salsicius]|uniref:AAA family ATPase n=1 Tax=Leucobacter salsicius TaxID=664638 RepID=UPI00034D9171|nr:AAA family ATPase [Leucobacter salsicius]